MTELSAYGLSLKNGIDLHKTQSKTSQIKNLAALYRAAFLLAKNLTSLAWVLPGRIRGSRTYRPSA